MHEIFLLDSLKMVIRMSAWHTHTHTNADTDGSALQIASKWKFAFPVHRSVIKFYFFFLFLLALFHCYFCVVFMTFSHSHKQCSSVAFCISVWIMPFSPYNFCVFVQLNFIFQSYHSGKSWRQCARHGCEYSIVVSTVFITDYRSYESYYYNVCPQNRLTNWKNKSGKKPAVKAVKR